jgi:hypothetical protein
VPYSSPSLSKNKQIDSMQPQTHTDRRASEATVSARSSCHPTGANTDAEQPRPECTKDTMEPHLLRSEHVEWINLGGTASRHKESCERYPAEQ